MEEDRHITRRDFIRRAAVTCALSAGVGVAGYLLYSEEPVRHKAQKVYTFKDFRAERSAVLPSIVVTHGKDAEKMVRAAVERLGGIGRFIRPGERVLIKPNIAWDRQPELAVNTNPLVVAAVVRLCKEGRAGEVWVTDVTINDASRCFKRSGIEDAVVRSGGVMKICLPDDMLMTDLRGDLLKVWPVNGIFHKVDRLINIPIAKHHSLSKCSFSMKNWYGVLGGRRNQLHQDIHMSIADLGTAIRPTLTIMDATRVLRQNGPTGGNLSDVAVEDTIIAGLNEVAIDAYSCHFLDIHAEDVPYLKIAMERGVGTVDFKGLHIEEMGV